MKERSLILTAGRFGDLSVILPPTVCVTLDKFFIFSGSFFHL